MIQNFSVINSELIDAIKAKAKGSPIEMLAKILPISKEALYRRLRGDVLFTYSEAVLIAKALNISLDNISYNKVEREIGNGKDTSSANEELQFANTVKLWSEKILFHATDESEIMVMTPSLPMSFVFKYRSLVKLNYYLSLYQLGKIDEIKDSYESIHIPPILTETFENTFSKILTLSGSYIITNDCFSYYTKRIRFLKELDVIGYDEIKSIKEDLFSLLEDINTAMSSHNNRYDQATVFYLSEINIDNTVGVIDNTTRPLIFTKTIGVNYITPSSLDVFREYKQSIESMKKFSNVISQSGSKKRLAFIRNQAAVIGEIEEKPV